MIKSILFILSGFMFAAVLGCSMNPNPESINSKKESGSSVLSIKALAACNINMSSYQQTIDGFGFSSAWSGKLSSAKNDALYNILGMSLLRIRIDPNQSWADETANASAAHAYGAKVLGSPWSPPANMKDNNNVVHGSLLASQYANYASYLNQAANSIGLDYVSIQNEPDWNPDYEGCVWSGDQMKTFCANNAQAIGKPVVMAEAVNFQDKYTDPTLNDPTAASHVSIIAGHFYGGGNSVHQNALNKGKHVWMTEHYIDNTQTGMSNCIKIAKEMNEAMNNQFSAYFWWWVADYDKSINLVDSSGKIFKNGYTMGQFAKWIRPGSKRVTADYNPSTGVFVTAYRVNEALVIVAVNTNSSSVNQQFNIQNGNATSVAAYRTSDNENMDNTGSITVSGGSFTAILPGMSITTFVQNASNSNEYNLPGKVEAENYSVMYGVQTEACGEGTLNVGWVDTGDWMDYPVNVQSAGIYKFEYRVASLYSGGKVDLLVNGTTLSSTVIPTTGAWQTYTTVTATLNLNAGKQTIRLYASGPYWNINWFNVIVNNNSSSSSSLSASSSSKSSAVSSSVSSASSSTAGNYVEKTAPLSFDGAGEYYWKMTGIPSYINSWNLDVLDINGESFLNKYASASALPAKQGGYYYIHYKASYAWSHFEAK